MGKKVKAKLSESKTKLGRTNWAELKKKELEASKHAQKDSKKS